MVDISLLLWLFLVISRDFLFEENFCYFFFFFWVMTIFLLLIKKTKEEEVSRVVRCVKAILPVSSPYFYGCYGKLTEWMLSYIKIWRIFNGGAQTNPNPLFGLDLLVLIFWLVSQSSGLVTSKALLIFVFFFFLFFPWPCW